MKKMMREKQKMSKYFVQLLGEALSVPLKSQALLLKTTKFNSQACCKLPKKMQIMSKNDQVTSPAD
jgi:hypothetical protein